MIKSILLRFRDSSTENTILEHQEIISKYKYTWWGWWKKDSEPYPHEEIKEIVTILQKGPMEIGLFNRSENKFYRANLVEIFNKEQASVPSPELELTPSYYNKFKLPAWFKLVQITEVSKEEFEEYLSSMLDPERTFFIVGADEEKIVIDRHQLKSNYVLHLTDLHLGDDYGFPEASNIEGRSVIDILVSDLHKLGIQIGLVIVSGDLISRGKVVLFQRALDFLNQLIEKLNLTNEEVVIIPGNHDIPIDEYNFKNYEHEVPYLDFLRKFYNKEKKVIGIDKFHLKNGVKLDVLRMNSVRLRKDDEKNFGYVEWPLYDTLLTNSELEKDSYKIAVIHHHLITSPAEENFQKEYKYGGFSLTLDAGKVIEGLQAFGFNMVLNGHQHLPLIQRVSRGRITENKTIEGIEKDLYLLSGGSCGVKDGRFTEYMKLNTYNILNISEDNLEIFCREYTRKIEPRNYFTCSLPLK